MNKQLPSVTISGLALSDLFFNHENENYAAACRDSYGSNMSNTEYVSAIREALITDAKSFIEQAGIQDEISPLDMVNDFLARI